MGCVNIQHTYFTHFKELRNEHCFSRWRMKQSHMFILPGFMYYKVVDGIKNDTVPFSSRKHECNMFFSDIYGLRLLISLFYNVTSHFSIQVPSVPSGSSLNSRKPQFLYL